MKPNLITGKEITRYDKRDTDSIVDLIFGPLVDQPKRRRTMNPRMKKLLVNAAMAGMIAGVGTMAPATAFAATGERVVHNGCSGKDGCGSKSGAKAENTDRHACKGMNACKGQGNCASGDNSCAGKNSCKGKGGCASEDAKHGCKGQNDCKGLGGCKSGDNGCAAKNSCKGKGGCAVPVQHDEDA
jgi:hypothetical protein